MIPKKIHYCWFGRGQMPESAKYYINSWKKELPDYELKLWNEDTFDINSNCYVKEAYESKKFAFVTDYVRLYALYTEGGIYMDTDVEVLRNLDIFLCHKAFSGFESLNQVPTGIMGSEKGLSIIKELLDYYNDKHFIDENGNMVIGDEMLTPDSSRFWPAEGYEPGHGQPSFDKQFARDWLKENKDHNWTLPQDIVDKTIDKYLQAYEMLTGEKLK